MSSQNKQEPHVGPESQSVSKEYSTEGAEDSSISSDEDPINQIDPPGPLSLEACAVRLVQYLCN